MNSDHLWWNWTIGVSWRHPQGPDSDVDQLMNHPVVHVCYDDALAPSTPDINKVFLLRLRSVLRAFTGQSFY
ncbi:MAG: SUMF1/EgtB/PvdO family nonheme iron enzyme [Bacteroidota bacterium]